MCSIIVRRLRPDCLGKLAVGHVLGRASALRVRGVTSTPVTFAGIFTQHSLCFLADRVLFQNASTPTSTSGCRSREKSAPSESPSMLRCVFVLIFHSTPQGAHDHPFLFCRTPLATWCMLSYQTQARSSHKWVRIMIF